jgi:hypothetical protein
MLRLLNFVFVMDTIQIFLNEYIPLITNSEQCSVTHYLNMARTNISILTREV